MTEDEYKKHAEQMKLARAEFIPFWDSELKTPRLQQMNNSERCVAQTLAWRSFLSSRGLQQ